jgi:uncharacterized membrane protein YdcZ (DUF606 family)
MSPDQMRSSLGTVALAGLVLSLAVHVATSLGLDVYSRFPLVFLLHFVALVLFGLFALTGGYRLKFEEVTSRLPGWALAVGAVTVAYVLVNSLICAGLSGEGNANVLQGQYVLMSHGRVLAHISEHDYHLHRAYELRLYSGLWVASCLVSAIYFFLWHKNGHAAG